MRGWARWGVVAAAFAVVSAGSPTVAYAAGGTITGRVTDAAGTGLGDVCIRLTVPTVYSGAATTAKTNADGTYAVHAAAGSYLLAFADCGGRDLVTSYWPGVRHRSTATPVTVADDQTVSGMDGRLEQGGSMSGLVTNTSGTPLAGTVVDIRLTIAQNVPLPTDERIVTGADGRFVARGLPVGAYRVTYHPGGTEYASVLYGNTADANLSPDVEVAAAQARTNTDALVPRRAMISGIVRDDDGAPHERVCVQVTPSLAQGNLTRYARTADDGTYTVGELAPGTFRVEFSDCSRVTAAKWYPAAKSFGEATPVTVTEGAAVTGIDGVYSRGLQVTGTVRGQDGTPLDIVSVAVYDGITGRYTGRGATTDRDGRYTLTGLRGTIYKLHFYGSGQHPDVVDRWWPNAQTQDAGLPVSLVAGVSLTDVDMTLPKGGRILGKVTDAAGNPAHGICVYAVNPLTSQSNGTRVDVAGSYVLRALDYGAYQVFYRSCGEANWAPRYYGGNHDPATAKLVTVELEKDTPGIDATVVPGGTITGRVVDAAGAPIAQACAYPYREGPGLRPPAVSNTDADGRYTITALPPATDYRVRFWDCFVKPARYVDIWHGGVEDQYDAPRLAVGSGDRVTANVTMERGGNFSGTVYDQFDLPLYGICVRAIDSAGRHRSAAFTDHSGTFNVGGLRAGTYRAYFYDCGAGIVSSVYHPDVLLESQGRTFEVRAAEETAGIDAKVTVVTTPKAPIDVSVAPGDTRAVVSWRPPTDTGNSPLTAFEVRDPNGLVVARTGATARSAAVTGLANGTTYEFTVNAVNIKGAGDDSAPVSVRPRPAARMSVTVPRVVVSGSSATVTGRLTDPTGTGLVGASVDLYGRRRGSTAAMTRITYAPTSSTGSFRLAIRPAYPMEYSVRYAGSSTLGGVRVAKTLAVSPRLGVSVSRRTVYVSVSPAAGGGRARLQVLRDTGWVSVVGADVPSTGRVTLRAPSGGTYRVVFLRSGWATATSARMRLA